MKTKRYWLRGGLIVAAIMFIADLWGTYSFFVTYKQDLNYLAIVNYFFFPNVWSAMGDLMIYLGLWFIVGAILGWLYGKIKNRNKVK